MSTVGHQDSRTLLLLGGSQQQVVAIETAKSCGYRTVLCDYLKDNPGQYVADTFYLISTTDREAVLEVARAERIDGVIAYSSDPAAPTAAYVAEQLRLPTNPLRTVEILSKKHLFREHLHDKGFPCPPSFTFHRGSSTQVVLEALQNLRFPVVVKPTDSSGSKGVTVLTSLQHDDAYVLSGAISHAAKYSCNDTLICEEFIERAFPYVIGGDIFVVDGKVEFWGLMSCLRDKNCQLVPVGKKTPSGLSQNQYIQVKDVLQKLVGSLGIQFGELNVEVILGKDDIPYVLELGARAGGNMIPLQLADISGINLVQANVMCAMGDAPGALAWEPDKTQAYATYVLHTLTDGIYTGLSISDAVESHVYRKVIYQDPGISVFRFDGADKALGVLFMRFDNESQMNDVLGHIDSHVRIGLSTKAAPIVKKKGGGRS